MANDLKMAYKWPFGTKPFLGKRFPTERLTQKRLSQEPIFIRFENE